ncbi:MAG TPA: hypothetical protein VGC69_19225 [Bordetella sp.]
MSAVPGFEPVELARSYLLLNHGPTVLVGSAHAGRRNVMAAAWADPQAFSGNRWHFASDARRSLHYVAGGTFFATGEPFSVPVET